jgi:excisionase family DNA binding protein
MDQESVERTDACRDALAVSVDRAAEMCALGRVTLYQMMAAGQLPFVKVGRRRLLLVEDLRALLASNRRVA